MQPPEHIDRNGPVEHTGPLTGHSGATGDLLA